MLNKLILFSLKNRLLVVSLAALIMVYGVFTLIKLPVDVLPDLNRPRVTIFLEANGMAPEEIETQVNLPVETQLNGAPGVEVVRSVASPGLGMVFVEFDWNTDVYRARQQTPFPIPEMQQNEPLPHPVHHSTVFLQAGLLVFQFLQAPFHSLLKKWLPVAGSNQVIHQPVI